MASVYFFEVMSELPVDLCFSASAFCSAVMGWEEDAGAAEGVEAGAEADWEGRGMLREREGFSLPRVSLKVGYGGIDVRKRTRRSCEPPWLGRRCRRSTGA
jgi:hypothetical protein